MSFRLRKKFLEKHPLVKNRKKNREKPVLVVVKTPLGRMEPPGGEDSGCSEDSNKSSLTMPSTLPSISPQRADKQDIIKTLVVLLDWFHTEWLSMNILALFGLKVQFCNILSRCEILDFFNVKMCHGSEAQWSMGFSGLVLPGELYQQEKAEHSGK